MSDYGILGDKNVEFWGFEGKNGTKMPNFGVLETKILNFGVLKEEIGTKLPNFGVLKGKMGQKCLTLGF